ncbi:MAG: phosphoglycolate phosphatase [Rhodospirillales bacterium]
MAVTQVIIFDLDGTLVDTAGDLAFAVNEMLSGRGLGPLPFAMVVSLVGEGARRLVERALLASGERDAAQIEPALRDFLAIYGANLTRSTQAYPGVAETLDRLAGDGYRLAVCTNKPEAHSRVILERLGLIDRFKTVVGGDTLPGVRKPDPRMLAPIFDALSITADAAVFVGDSITDVTLARRAGMAVIVRAGGYSTLPAADLGADAVIDSWTQLPDAIRRLP